MRRAWFLVGVLVAGLLAACEEGPDPVVPDQVTKRPSSDLDAAKANGWLAKGFAFDGKQPFEVSSSGQQSGTVKICEADELTKRWTAMKKAPIIPAVGLGGLDLRGTPKWAGLSIDIAQQQLCQAYVAAEDMYYWGDNNELIAFFDPKTRIIDSLGAFTGYEGKITAGGYELGINLQITKDGKALADPYSDNTIRTMNQAFVKAFRPEVANPEQRDCVALSSCYVRDWNTLKLFVFLDLGLYVAVEPKAQKITTIQLALQRNFEFSRADVKFEMAPMPPAGLPPTPKIAWSATCQPTMGQTWEHIKTNCLGIDPEEKALMSPVWGNEALYADMGGVSVYLVRPSLPKDQIIPDGTRAVATDKVVGLGFNQLYEGKLLIDRASLYGEFLKAVAQKVKDRYPDVDMEPAFAKLKPLDDATKLTIGTQRIEDCTDATCPEATLTIRTRELVEAQVKSAKGTVPSELKNPNFYVELFIRELLRIFNDGKLPTPSDVYLYFSDENAEIMYGRLARKIGNDRYSVTAVYQYQSDQVLALFFKQGSLRTEEILFRDAELVQYDKKQGDGVFRLWNLVRSPRIGLAKTVFPKTVMQQIERALVTVNLDTATEILVGYHKEDALSGFSIPIEGKRDLFVPAAYYGFSGNTVGAGMWASGKDGIIKAVSSGAFYDELDFCGVKAGLWGMADELMNKLPSSCDPIISFSENGKFLRSMSTYVQTTPYKIGVRIQFLAGRVNGAYYWAEQ